MNVLAAIDARLCPVCREPIVVTKPSEAQAHLREHSIMALWWFIARIVGRMFLIRLHLVRDTIDTKGGSM